MDKTLDCMGKGERQDNNERHRKVTFHSYWKFVKTTISDLLTKRYCIYVENSQKSDQFSNNLSTDTKGISLLEKCCYQTEYNIKMKISVEDLAHLTAKFLERMTINFVISNINQSKIRFF